MRYSCTLPHAHTYKKHASASAHASAHAHAHAHAQTQTRTSGSPCPRTETHTHTHLGVALALQVGSVRLIGVVPARETAASTASTESAGVDVRRVRRAARHVRAWMLERAGGRQQRQTSWSHPAGPHPQASAGRPGPGRPRRTAGGATHTAPIENVRAASVQHLQHLAVGSATWVWRALPQPPCIPGRVQTALLGFSPT